MPEYLTGTVSSGKALSALHKTGLRGQAPSMFRPVSRPVETQALVRGVSSRAVKVLFPPAGHVTGDEAEYAQHPAPALPDEKGRVPQTTAILPRPGSDAEHYNREITARTAAGAPAADLHLTEALEALLAHDERFARAAEEAMESASPADVDRILRGARFRRPSGPAGSPAQPDAAPSYEARRLFCQHLFTYLVEYCSVANTPGNEAVVLAAAKAELNRAEGGPVAHAPALARLVSARDFQYAMDRTKSELKSELASLVRKDPYLLLRFDVSRADMVARAALAKLRDLHALGIVPVVSAASAAFSARATGALTPTAAARKPADPDAGILAALRYAALRYAAQKCVRPRPASGQAARAA